MAPHPRHERDDLLCGRKRPAQHCRGEVTFDRGPRALRPLAAVERIFAGHALSPGIDAIAVYGQQKDSAAESALKARLEKMDKRHLNFTLREIQMPLVHFFDT